VSAVYLILGAGLFTACSEVVALDQTLQKLEPVRIDVDNSTRPACLPGTRTRILQSIQDWASHPSVEQRILWLSGLTGSGKTTISTTIANHFNEEGCLGAHMFFDRRAMERSRPFSVVRTLAHRLGSFDPRIGTAIAKIMSITSNITQLPLVRQFTTLIINPLLSLPTTETPIVIVLDALDECGNDPSDREALLATLAVESAKLPSIIRIIITSRKEPDIMTAFMAKPHILVEELDITTDDNKEDIRFFLETEMSKILILNSRLRLPSDWPGDDKIQDLVRRAAGLFVWASTACLFIKGHAPQKRLDTLLQGDIDANAQSALDRLYITALKSVSSGGDEDFQSDFRSIMGVIIVARDPLSDEAIDTLLRLERPSCHTISKLGCVLHWTDGKPVRILHPSFADCLSNRLRCDSDALYIDIQLHNKRLATHSLQYLDTILKTNICNLTLSPAPVQVNLPEAISYASRFWIDHVISMTELDQCFANELEQFLFRHLLHWLEAMSLLQKSREAIPLLRSLLTWAEVSHFCCLNKRKLDAGCDRHI